MSCQIILTGTIIGAKLPVSDVQLCSSGVGIHEELLEHKEIFTAVGRNLSLHW